MNSQSAPDDPPRGRGRKAILNPSATAPITIERYAAPRFAYWIDYIWIVRWHVDGVFTQRVIPQPIIHLAAEDGRILVHGVGNTDFSRTLRGDGHVVGVAFRPAAFHAVLRRPVSEITRSVRPLGEVIDVDDRPLAHALLNAERSDAEHLSVIDDLIESIGLQRDSTIEELAELVTLAENDTAVTRAEQLSSHAGVSLRTLQRLFGEYVGIGPKWVIQRFRLLDVARVANTEADIDWASTAAELGFSDQSHLIRAFTALVGTSPALYVHGDSDETAD
ncbi:helix-turn-helix domain-containing protein [Gordonia sp. CPCC 205333]|uniref:helix-turn-helix domain-containing protein n=1 Tax=Gordonia sp. CPCC 205333 TaxID=3140790 RepID=UPI003AF374E5